MVFDFILSLRPGEPQQSTLQRPAKKSKFKLAKKSSIRDCPRQLYILTLIKLGNDHFLDDFQLQSRWNGPKVKGIDSARKRLGRFSHKLVRPNENLISPFENSHNFTFKSKKVRVWEVDSDIKSIGSINMNTANIPDRVIFSKENSMSRNKKSLNNV